MIKSFANFSYSCSLPYFPFSFREFLELKGIKETNVYTTKEKAEILNCLNEYLKIGGFPEVNKFGKAILLRIYDDILIKDILLRYKIKKIEDIRKLAKYLITNFSEEFSYRKLSKMLGVKHVSTVSNWVSYLQNSFLILKLERFDFKLKKQFLSPKKVYCIDNGIITSISFSFSENLGRIIENVVAIELQRKFCGKEIYYWKSLHNEVDFVVKEGNEVRELIQVSYVNVKEEIKEREIKSLLKASDDLKCENLTIITWDYENEETLENKKIKFVPLWKWLLNL